MTPTPGGRGLDGFRQKALIAGMRLDGQGWPIAFILTVVGVIDGIVFLGRQDLYEVFLVSG